MKHASLFSGIGGFDLAAQWMGWENVFQVEWDEWCQKILTKNFPNVEKYKDIKEFDGTKFKGTVDIISGGFPCQPFSTAGKRQGEADDRYLWPEMLRVIREVKPAYVVGENVAGLVSMENGKTLEGILSDLENEGYQTESFIIPACGVGAWHRRDRIWIISYNANPGFKSMRGWENKTANKSGNKNATNSNAEGLQRGGHESREQKTIPENRTKQLCADVSDSNREFWSKGRENRRTKQSRYGNSFQENGSYWQTEPDVGRVADGISNRVDRLKGLGNAIVPQVAFELFKAIDQINFAD